MTTFDIAPDFAVSDRWPISAVREVTISYHDTAELALLQAGITVRLTGNRWRLNAGDHAQRWPVIGDEPPEELLRLLKPWAPDGIRPVLRLRISRTEHEVLDSAGVRKLTLSDDQIRAISDGPTLTTSRWRTLRVGRPTTATDQDVLAAEDELVGRGAVKRLASLSGLSIAVCGHRAIPGSGTAGEVLAEYLSAQCDAMVGGHFAVSKNPFDDEPATEPPEAVHRMRVASRRLRAMLRSFAELLDAQAGTRLEAELVWFAGVLGPVRDLEVLRSRLSRAVAELPSELVVGPLADQIDGFLKAELHDAVQALLAALADERYRELVTELASWRNAPPFTELADRPAASLGHLVDAAEQALYKKLKRASKDPQDEKLHSARKAGKRARYAAEATAALLGKRASRLASSAEQLQALLGEHQDAVVAIQVLHRIADQVAKQGGNTFSYGILVAEQTRLATTATDAATDTAKSGAASD